MNNLLEIIEQAYLVGFRDARTTPDEIDRRPLALNYATKAVKNLTIPDVSIELPDDAIHFAEWKRILGN